MYHWLKRTINKSLFGINCLFSGLLLLSYLAAFVPPSSFYYLALLALGYPFLLFSNILFAAWWLYRRKRYFYVSIASILIGYAHFSCFFGFHFGDSTATASSLKIMSYNVRYFDAPFHQKKQTAELDKAHLDIMNIIAKEEAAIFCGQEFSGKTDIYNQRTKLIFEQKLGMPYSYTAGGSSLAIYSKYPIVHQGAIRFEQTHNGAIFADIKTDKKTYRVYCFHLQSIRLSGAEKEAFQQQNITTLNKDSTQQKYKEISGKLKNAFVLREQQVKFMQQHIQESPHPVIVCGDMNDTPTSYAYHHLSQNLNDAFLQQEWGWGSTYAGSLPFLRIDYTFVSPEVTLQHFEVIRTTTSDHYPICTQIKH